LFMPSSRWGPSRFFYFSLPRFPAFVSLLLPSPSTFVVVTLSSQSPSHSLQLQKHSQLSSKPSPAQDLNLSNMGLLGNVMLSAPLLAAISSAQILGFTSFPANQTVIGEPFVVEWQAPADDLVTIVLLTVCLSSLIQLEQADLTTHLRAPRRPLCLRCRLLRLRLVAPSLGLPAQPRRLSTACISKMQAQTITAMLSPSSRLSSQLQALALGQRPPPQLLASLPRLQPRSLPPHHPPRALS